MSIRSEWVSYGTKQRGFLAWPDRAKRPLPSVIVIQEVWGVEGQIEAVTQRVAASGYVALAPDVFSSLGPRPAALSAERLAQVFAFRNRGGPSLFNPSQRQAALATLAEPERSQINETAEALGVFLGRLPALVGPLREAVTYLRQHREESRGQGLACVGFCMGGGLSALLSCEEPEVAAAAVFYGRSPAEEAIRRGVSPIVGFYAEHDPNVNEGIAAFAEAMAKAGRAFDPHRYPGTQHGFFNEDGAAYDADAARDSWVKLLQFLRAHIVP